MRAVSFNTPAEVTTWLRQAAECVEAADLPADVEAIGFAKACDWLSARNVQLEPSDFGRIEVPRMDIPGNHRH
jgi:hypothetical protein